MYQATRLARHRDGVPVYDYRTDPVTPPISIVRFDRHTRPEQRAHIHDFPVLLYQRDTGAVYVVAAGRVVDVPEAEPVDDGFAVFFDPGVLGGDEHAPWPTWRSHPLLFPFLHGRSDGLLRLCVPVERRPRWEDALEALESELDRRQDGYRQAAAAYLTLLLIDLARLAADVVGDLRRSGEPLLAEVFTVIDQQHTEALSLRDVARAVNMTPGHLTTVVRRRTGRTVQDWIIDRRMSEARRLLATTDLPIAEIAHRIGLPDPGYFTRVFRRAHGLPPRRWRAEVSAG